jgi:hypothetical protein
MPLRRLAITAALVLTAALPLAACGGEEPTHAATEGIYVNTGDLKYQVQVSRQLTPADFEDRDFLIGLPAGETPKLAPGEEWFAVFIRVFNMTNTPHQSSSQFTIRDTTGKTFEPVAINTNINRVAYHPAVVGGGDQIPVPGSLARENTTQGAMLLFKVPTESYSNRPLELHIAPPEGGAEATVDLDV